ncbi:hypothetical protein H5410_061298 [Solanum commersonii]|uniref:Uncharacterized protein n=1 Tax=Solanum commersonii TaxID=4109 RepID=A0A9J5W8H2_SOLCO|nr:hypothetical protein H5410_061298 [Solanum commersonii]
MRQAELAGAKSDAISTAYSDISNAKNNDFIVGTANEGDLLKREEVGDIRDKRSHTSGLFLVAGIFQEELEVESSDALIT